MNQITFRPNKDVIFMHENSEILTTKCDVSDLNYLDKYRNKPFRVNDIYSFRKFKLNKILRVVYNKKKDIERADVFVIDGLKYRKIRDEDALNFRLREILVMSFDDGSK